MATCYEDIIKIRACKATFDITDKESATEWVSFIANEQFNNLLRTVIKSVRANDIDNHKSFWLHGTYGTGKSHAAAVISHLLGDKEEEIEQWLNDEYRQDKKLAAIREDILELRKSKRLLPVNIKGLESMARASDLALVIQRSVTDTLNEHHLTLSESIRTEFDNYVNHIKSNDEMWALLIKTNNELSAIVSDCNQLVSNLKKNDIETYRVVTSALRAKSITIGLKNSNIASWLIETQNALAAKGEYNGFLIVWDEFTDVMREIGVQALKELQTIAEAFASGDNNSYLFLISHPSAFNHMNSDQQKQTDGRYHKEKYNMESVSAFRIMSRKFIIGDVTAHEKLGKQFYNKHQELLDIFSQTSNDADSTKKDIFNLFPLHPGTANLAAHYATVAGSSSRSVFEFLGQNDDIKSFLSDEEQFSKKATITADFLWDYVLKFFQGDIRGYGAVTERFSSHQQKVANQGASYLAVFKATLLLNALNNIAAENNNSLVTPSEENIKRLFIGTEHESHIDDILTWFNENEIIQRSPSGLFSVQFSALPAKEIEDFKNSLREKEFKHTYKIVEFIDSKKDTFAQSLNLINRPYQYGCFSRLQNRACLKNEIKKARRKTSAYKLFFAFLFSKDEEELDELQAFAKECTQDESDKELEQIVFIVFEKTFSVENYERFIEYQANCECASTHGLADQVRAHKEDASGTVRKWIDALLRGTAFIYIKKHENSSCSFTGWSQKVNSEITPFLYPYAPDAHPALRIAKGTFWKKQNSKNIVRKMLDASSPDDFINNLNNAQMSPIRFLIQNALENNWKWKPDVAPNHPLKKVEAEVASIIDSASKSDSFNLAEKFEVLTKPPYGLFSNFACMAMVAFSLRSRVGKIFDTAGKPLLSPALTERISDLFKAWEANKPSSKLDVKLQTPEEEKLCKELVSLFNLNRLDPDSTSLKKAIALITLQFAAEKKAPLWAIKYTPKGVCGLNPPNDEMKTLIDNIFSICIERESDNSSLYNKTLSLIDTYRFEMQNILKEDAAFREGLKNFLTSIPEPHISGCEVDKALEYVSQHSESTIGYWTENKVVELAKDWRLTTRRLPKPIPPDPPPGPSPDPGPPGKPPILPGDPEDPEKALQKARNRIKNITTLDEAKKLLEVLCESRISSIIEIINS